MNGRHVDKSSSRGAWFGDTSSVQWHWLLRQAPSIRRGTSFMNELWARGQRHIPNAVRSFFWLANKLVHKVRPKLWNLIATPNKIPNTLRKMSVRSWYFVRGWRLDSQHVPRYSIDSWRHMWRIGAEVSFLSYSKRTSHLFNRLWLPANFEHVPQF